MGSWKFLGKKRADTGDASKVGEICSRGWLSLGIGASGYSMRGIEYGRGEE